jgi:hypothetical protein
MLDDHRRNAMAAVGDLSHRGSLPMVSPPSYPVILTKPLGIINQTGKSKTVVCARFGLKESAKKKRFYVRWLTLLRRRKC